jgi:hypothetical protein
MSFGNDQEMNGSFRVDVLKNYQVFIFKKDFRWQLSGYNLTKYAGHDYPFRIGLQLKECNFFDQVPFYHRIERKGRRTPEGKSGFLGTEVLFVDKSPIKW